MAWIESHQELARHPKTKKFARLLGVSLPAALGHLHLFWWWAMDYAQDGDISRYDMEELADACGWEGEPKKMFHALLDAGFTEGDNGDYHIHDWFDYAGRLIEQREKNKERKRMSRAKKGDVTRPSRGQASDDRESHGATEPNPTIPNQTEPLSTTTADAPPSETFYRAHERVFGFGPTPIQSEELGTYIDDGIEESVIIRAIERAGTNGTGHSYPLVKKIMNDYLAAGVKTLVAAEEFDRDYERRKSRQTQQRGQPSKPKLEIIKDTPKTAVTPDQLEKMREVARKLDKGG